MDDGNVEAKLLYEAQNACNTQRANTQRKRADALVTSVNLAQVSQILWLVKFHLHLLYAGLHESRSTHTE